MCSGAASAVLPRRPPSVLAVLVALLPPSLLQCEGQPPKPSMRCVLGAVWLVISLILPSIVAGHGSFLDQIGAATKRIEQDPTNAELYLKRGELHRLHREWDAALADYERAARLDPSLALVDLARGIMLSEADRPQAARVALDRFLAAHSDHVHARVARARVLVRLGEHLAAAGDFTRAIARLPEPKPEHYLERAQALAADGDGRIDEALRGLDEGLERLGPLVTLQLLAIDLEIKKKRYDAALARLDRIVALAARKETGLARRGEILEQAGRPSEAREAYGAALAAIESLPSSLRSVKATANMEQRLRTAQTRLTRLEEQPYEGTPSRRGVR